MDIPLRFPKCRTRPEAGFALEWFSNCPGCFRLPHWRGTAAGGVMPNNRAPMAIIYDFDGTLAPGNMQDHLFIPNIGMEPEDFWPEVDRMAQDLQADGILMYMYLMLEKARAAHVPVHREDFCERGRGIRLFDGVAGWFDRINGYGKSSGVDVDHYIVSSGNAEILEGIPIVSYFKKIYASKFLFDETGAAIWPALAINFTTKTQYLFRINKGAHDLGDNRQINEYVAKADRPVPFENMVYIGDGPTDVPCFRLVKDQGGLSIAVFQPDKPNARDDAEEFLRDGRVHNTAPTVYAEGSELDRIVKRNIDLVAARRGLAETQIGG